MKQVAIFIGFREFILAYLYAVVFSVPRRAGKTAKSAVEPLKIYIFGNWFPKMPSLKRPCAFFHPLEGYAGRS